MTVGGSAVVPHAFLGLAAAGATASVVLVRIVELVLHPPLAEVQEQGLTVVGALLICVGIVWSTQEGTVSWPREDAALPVLAVAAVAYALGSMAVPRRGASTSLTAAATSEGT